MAPRKQTQTDEPQVFEQRPDERGRIRLDRPLTAAEAAAQDAEHAALLVEDRNARFSGRRAA